MNRIPALLCTVFALILGTSPLHADSNAGPSSGNQPWWNTFAKRDRYLTPEDQRLQQFWHDYYASLKAYYSEVDHIDWVAYYKNHGYQINAGCSEPGCCNNKYAPVFVSPAMQWAVPGSSMPGPRIPGFYPK